MNKTNCTVKNPFSLIQDIKNIKNIPDCKQDDKLRKDLFEAEVKLNTIVDTKIERAKTRSRAQWTEEGEHST